MATTACTSEAGAVPGWMLIALMIAGLVAVVFQSAHDEISGVLEWAVQRLPW